jgi:hypothetical protein
MEEMLQYIDQIVEPTIRDLADHPTSVRYAFLACVATFHSIDYLAYPKKPSGLRQRVNQESVDFRVVDNVAHAFKHVVVGKRAEPKLSATQIITRPPAVCGEMVAGLSFVGDENGGVTLSNDQSIELLGTLYRTVEFLRSNAVSLQGLKSEQAGSISAASLRK